MLLRTDVKEHRLTDQYNVRMLAHPAAMRVRSDAGAPRVYISDELRSFIAVFARDGRRIATITSGLSYPTGLYVDAKQNLYVANAGGHDVLKFKRGGTSPVATYQLAEQQSAWGVTMCPDGTLFAAAGAQVAAFAPGHHRPTDLLTSDYGSVTSVTCDASGNVFATATLFSPPGYVLEFAGGKNPDTVLPIDLNDPSDVKIDPAGNLLVLDNERPSSVIEYTEAGSPTGKSVTIADNWSQIAVPPSGDLLFGVDVTQSAGELMTFPSGRLRQSYTDSSFVSTQPYGVAYDRGS